MTGLALTILLAVLWVALIAAGFWHGGWRQVVTLAGMLLAYAVASEWAVPNGHDLAVQFHASLARTTTVVGLLYLIGGILLVGVLGSFALARPVPLSMSERSAGAAMGVLNGGVLLALVLRTLRSYAFGPGNGRTLEQSALARFLIERVGYLLLVALVIAAAAAVVGAMLARRSPTQLVAVVEESQFSPAFAPVPPELVASASPAAVPVAATALEPVYANAPLIDWPANSPAEDHIPGLVTAPEAEPPGVTAQAVPTANGSVGMALSDLLPTHPVVPHRIAPPLLYPVERLVSASASQAPAPPPTSLPARPPAPEATMPVVQQSPPAVPQTAVAQTSAPQPAPPLARPFVRPTSPPPGALQPAFVPPTLARPPAQPPNTPKAAPPAPIAAPHPRPDADTNPPVVRELDVVTGDAAPHTHEAEETSPEPAVPVVRELEVTTSDGPPAAIAPAVGDAKQVQAADDRPPDAPKETPMKVAEQSSTESPGGIVAKKDTAQIPAVPPPLPPAPVARSVASAQTEAPTPAERPALASEEARTRTGFARVAVARQAGARPDQPPAPQQTPAQPEPLAPPRPAGPRVHACPVCGYPVRDHARYCPNCGSRQRS